MTRILGIDYGDSRVGVAVSDALGITAQGLETIHHNGNDKIVLKRLEEIIKEYKVGTIAIGIPYKLKCKFNTIDIKEIDERLTTVAAHKTMNFLGVKNKEKKNIVDTLSAVYILEIYMKNQK